MVLYPVLYAFMALASVSVQPASVPARGEQSVTIQVSSPGMYHLSARSNQGTSCQVIDSRRGPFAQGGLTGERDCELDLLLDMGSYLVRLDSPEKGKGKVALDFKEFAEDRKEASLLPRAGSDHVELHPGHQVSWWISVEKRRDVELLVAGRSAGRVVLWRDGKWSQPMDVSKRQYSLRPGQPRYLWRLSGSLEPADYKLVVYGTEPKKWTKGKPDDSVFVTNGYENEAERLREFSLPSWGLLAIRIPASAVAVHMQLQKQPEDTVSLSIRDCVAEPGDRTTTESGRCSLASKTLVPECAAFSNSNSSHVLVVSGPPGTAGVLRWSGYLNQSYGEPTLADDVFAPPAQAIRMASAKNGQYLVGVVDMPSDPDAAPLSCELTSIGRSIFGPKVQREYVSLGRGRYLERRFNYDGRGQSIWFRVDDWGQYSISASGDEITSCELFSQDSKLTRKALGCKQSLPLAKGLYRFELYNGKPGIARVSIKPGAWAGNKLMPVQKTSCWFNGIKLGHRSSYRIEMNRRGRVAARGLVLRRLPLKLEKPLFIVLDPGEVMNLPVEKGSAVRVHASASNGFLCSSGLMPPSPRPGQTYLLNRVKQKTLLNIGNAGSSALWVSISRPRPKAKPAPLSAHLPKLRKFQAIEPGKSYYADFDRGQSHSLVLHVPKAGVYEATSLGLLSTSCTLRTPIFASLFSDRASGRGRNCLVAGYLNRGDYLFTATTLGQSKGRAGLTIARRKVKAAPPVADGGEVFFKVPAGQMVRQRLLVKNSRMYSLSTSAQGASLQCRLEDEKGWPLLPVPASCTQELRLKAGKYFWSQMPLTVDSSRNTSLLPVKDPEDQVLKGKKQYQLRLNRNYTVQLSKAGQDRFRFSVQAPMKVTISLDRNMIGKLTLLGSKNHWNKEIKAEPRAMDLVPGEYVLLTRHSMDDVGVRYHLNTWTDVLAPGVSKRDVQVPARLDMRVAIDSVVRIGTRGQEDVRCRLFDSAGQLKAESEHVGADWNCLAATFIKAGEYHLFIETADGSQGRTDVSVSSPRVQSMGPLQDGAVVNIGKNVLLTSLPATNGDLVQEVAFSSKLKFSCRLEDENGGALEEHLDVLSCDFLVRSLGQEHRVRLWTRRWSGKLKVRRTDRPVVAMQKGRIPVAKAARVKIFAAGRYKTGGRLFCLHADQSGPLLLCSGEASLEAGDVIFSAKGAKTSPRLSMKEMLFSSSQPSKGTWLLSHQPVWQRQHARASNTLHLLALRSKQGTSLEPLCSLIPVGLEKQSREPSKKPGTFRLAPGACFAACSASRDALGRWQLADDEKAQFALVDLHRLMVPIPAKAKELAPGRHELVWSGQVERYGLPKGQVRTKVLLPLASWAVLMDQGGSVTDICTPAKILKTCEFFSEGGELLLVSNSRRRAVVDVSRALSSGGALTLAGALELWPSLAKRQVIVIPASEQPRRLEVHGASDCFLAMDDGFRAHACSLDIPAGGRGRLELDLRPGPVSVVVSKKDAIKKTLWSKGLSGQSGKIQSLQPEQDISLARVAQKGGAWVLEVPALSLVSLKADSGLCALVDPLGRIESIGDGSGCKWHKLLSPGKWQLRVRPFAHKALDGALHWERLDPEPLHEGVGGEKWLAPGSASLFTFKVKKTRDIGLGIKADRDVLHCSVLDAKGQKKAQGCLALLRDLPTGDYFLMIELPRDEKAVSYRPVVLGLHGPGAEIPGKYLREFFQRIGGAP